MGDALGSRDNALNFVRLVLAVGVIWQHTFETSGFQFNEMLAGLPGEWGVNGFFAISGYLIVNSRLRLRVGAYLWRRSLRIFPAFWGALVLTAAVFAPLSSLLSGKDYNLSSIAGYVFRNLSLHIFQPSIGETLSGAEHETWNASLWTLEYEFVCYLAVGAVFSLALARRHLLTTSLVLLVVSTVGLLISYQDYEANEWGSLAFFRLASFFAAGTVFAALKNRVRVGWVMIPGALAVLGALYAFDLAGVLGQLPFAYMMLCLGALLPIRLGSENDISYGVYVYGYPVQQLLALSVGTSLGITGFFVASVAIAALLALLSWHLVEKQALKLKDVVSTRSPLRAIDRVGS